MKLEANGRSEIFFVDGALEYMSEDEKDALTYLSAYLLSQLGISNEVDVYVSKRSMLQAVDGNSHAWHLPPTYDRDNSVITVYVDEDVSFREVAVSLAHEMIHAWQTCRGDLKTMKGGKKIWKGKDMTDCPYEIQPWEIEARLYESDLVDAFVDDEDISEETRGAMSVSGDVALLALAEQYRREKEANKPKPDNGAWVAFCAFLFIFVLIAAAG